MNVRKECKSSYTQLSNRGYIDYLQIDEHFYSKDVAIDKLTNKHVSPVERSIAAKVLRIHLAKTNVCETLLQALTKEKALYTKIEITNTLACGNKSTLKAMLPYLGTIGHNQHKALPKTVNQKKTYPLPRDIVARCIGNMPSRYLGYLIQSYPTCSLSQQRELVDAIGMMMHKHNTYKKEHYKTLLTYYNECSDDILKWKLVQCMGPCYPANKDLLTMLSQEDSIYGKEAKRALRLYAKKDSK